MRTRTHGGRSNVALFTALCLVAQGVTPLLAQAPASSAAKAPASAKTTANAGATVVAPGDRGWPRSYPVPSGGEITIYQPQIASWENQKHMVAYAAVAHSVTGVPKPHLGSVKVEVATKVSLDERLVNFSPLKITEANFPTLGKDRTAEIVKEIDKAIPDHDRMIALDRVLAGLERSQIMPKNIEGVKAEPPAIFFSKKPAVLVNVDGDPIWTPIKDNELKYALNTNWDLFQHEPSKAFYLRHEQSWLQAADVKGPWAAAGKLPESFKKLPAEANWTDVKAALPGKKLSADKLPHVFVSVGAPSEMILLTGEPAYEAVRGTSLLWVSNTESDVFRLGQSGTIYYLLAGRWFSAPDFSGPWTFATPKLPEDFQKITLEHTRSRVLASVPGTQQAAEAVLLAQIPQTARVNKKQLKAPEVKYAGEPKFEKIEKSKVEHAVNTDKSILKVGDMYYMCFEGVWFMGKSPEGPWQVASKVPGEIYEIPISSPAHNVTYVTVEDDDDEWVTFASAAMYTGVMVAWGCAVWGSGWYYPPYYGGWYGGYPGYYGRYPTYGYGASYNPWTGAYGRGAVAYGPYGGAGVGARYNPSTGTYSRGAAAYGPYGSRAAGSAYNPRTGAYGATRQGSNVYGSWGSTAVQRGDQWAQTSRVTSNATGATTRATRTSGGGEAVSRTGSQGRTTVGRTAGGDVYAGHDGNVYRNDGGTWQKHENGGWSNTSGAARSTTDQLSRDSSARASGTQRTQDYGSYRSGGGSASSYRSSGASRGGSRGGGRRR